MLMGMRIKLLTMNRAALRATLALVAALGACAAPLAHGQIYLCIDANGLKELTDIGRPGCRALDVPGSIAAPARRGDGAPRSAPAPMASPANFPKVDTTQQKARDNERRDILSDELRSEEKKLAELKREFNGGEPERHGDEKNYAKYQERTAQLRDNVARSEKNVEALRRELSNIK